MIDLSLEDARVIHPPNRIQEPTRINPLDTERCVWVAEFGSEHLRRHSSHKFAGFDLVHKTPNPAFSRLDGTNQGVLRFVEMLGRMLVLGRIAAAHVPTRKTQAQVNPIIAGFHTVFAHMLLRFSDLDLIKMGTGFWHWFLLYLLISNGFWEGHGSSRAVKARQQCGL
jgi:hypothetical protein